MRKTSARARPHPGRPWRLTLHDWENLYRVFRTLWRRYVETSGTPQFGRQVLQEALNQRWPLPEVVSRAHAWLKSSVKSGDAENLRDLRSAWIEASELGYSENAPAESVYQTAIQVSLRALQDENDSYGEQRWFYRGQRCADWPTIPLTFRELPAEIAPEVECSRRIARVRSVVRSIQLHSGLSEFESLAVAQHYSKELNARPWLLDVTRSPYIALFFASHGATDDALGVLEYIERTEWLLFSEGAPETVGAIRYTSPQGILRIKNQDAFFIEAPHPDIYAQFNNRRYYFRQSAGVVFEDTTLRPAVTIDQIYPQLDPFLRRFCESEERTAAAPLLWEPSITILEPPDPSVYVSIVQQWFPHGEADLREIIESVCALHAIITREAAPPVATWQHSSPQAGNRVFVGAER